MTEAMLMGVARANCWTLAEALGHGGLITFQHTLGNGVTSFAGSWDRVAWSSAIG
jgi:hypothetical protein